MKKKKEKEDYVPLVPKKEIEPTKFHHTSNKFYIGFTTRMIVSFIIFFVVLAASIIVLRESFNIVKINEIEIKEKSNLDYKVYLNQNDIYDEEYLEKDMSYVAELINLIKVDIKYNFTVNKESDYDFKYQILGDLVIEDESSKDTVFYKKTYILSDEIKEMIEHDTKYDIDKTISIDYWYYNGLATKFKKDYKVSTKSYLKIYVDIIGETQDTNFYRFSNKIKPSITIPLVEDSIKIDTKNINNTKRVGNRPETTIRSLPLFSLGIVLLLVAILMLAQIIIKIKNIYPKKSLYDKTISKILNKYDDIIINTTTPPSRKNKIINVLEFKELLDVYNQVKEPIKYYVINEHNKCEFYLNHNKEIYILTIKAVDLEKKR